MSLTVQMEFMLKRSLIIICLCLAFAVAAGSAAAADTASVSADSGSGVREAAARGEVVEMHLAPDQGFTLWAQDPSVFKEDQGDRTEKRQVVEQVVKTVKLNNLVPPILFPLGKAEIPENYLELLRRVLDSMRGRKNVRLHFVGHTDSLPLRGDLIARYGDNVGLSRERAGTVAEYFQRALGLPPEAISYEGVGDSQPVASNATEEGRALNRRVEVQVWYDEISEKPAEKEVVVSRKVNRIKVCRTETVCKLRYKEGHAHRTRVRNLIAPLHYDQGMVRVPEEFLRQIRQALKNLHGKEHVVVKFIAYTDNTPLVGRDERIYGNHLGLSKAVARRVSLAVQDALGLPNAAIESEGKGATRPLASNDTPQGRALNRRVEVEFWHDDPLQELPDDPQLCPDASGAETVTKVYDSPSGGIAPILFENGKPVLPAGCIVHLRQIMNEARAKDKSNVRLRFVGYTGDQRLDRRTAAVYGDDIGLSTARARRAMAAVCEKMGLKEDQEEFEGHGYVQSDDVVNAGFIESDTSRVQVQVVYDDLVPLDDYDGVEITPMTREVTPADPFGLNLMRITVDGKPIDDPGKSVADVQRCTDVALDRAQIQFKYDNLKAVPRLNVTAWPRTIRYQDVAETAFPENLVRFRLYTNYHSFIARAEVRVFKEEQSARDKPLAVIGMDKNGMAQWQPVFVPFSAPGLQLKYLVRVYDKEGHFDETKAQPLWVVSQLDPSTIKANPDKELLVGYGESRIASRNIPLRGGTVEAQGTAIPPGYGVWLAGDPIPVDDKGNFVGEEILPEGMNTVEVAVLDKAGNGELFLRDLELKKSDWFTMGIADLTLSANKNSGPADLVAPDNEQYNNDLNLDGRLAFYTKGKFGKDWGLTASADTREGHLDDIFSNFLDKSPEALFRRIDPDYHFPTYGDDSTVVQDAPTNGKFYLKLTKEENYFLWGNFKIAYTDNYLAHVDRGLYGANLHYQTRDTTSFGEKRLSADGYAADPGTVAERDEFQGTDGSLYYLHHQDLLEGSERVRIEIRDKDSGIVQSVKYLTPSLDYTIDYLQGRILLAQPLPARANDGLLVKSDSVSGNPVFLVVNYEFTPGVKELSTMATGGRVHYWVNDHLKVGMTASQNDESGTDSNLEGADVTLRKSTDTWVRLEAGRTEGPGVLTTNSNEGGFDTTPQPLGGEGGQAWAYRVDSSLNLKDVFKNGRGRFTFYLQSTDAGYSAPGVTTDRDLTQYGGTAALPFTDRVKLRLKSDFYDQHEGLKTETSELDLDYQASNHWTVSSGVRHDNRKDNSPVVPQTQEVGERTDVVARVLYDSRARWNAYGFAQGSVQATGNREENARVGTGGKFQVTDRFKVNAEVSEGDLGAAGLLGTEYLYSDRTTIYLNYALENDRDDNGVRARKGNLISGFRTRYSDSASVFHEERYTYGDVPTGLTHSTGVELAPTDHLNLKANLDFGKLKDNETEATIKRTAAGVSVGYGFKSLKISSALEYRLDDSEQLDTSTTRRTTWLVRNNLKYQLSPDWRLIGKFNYSHSDSSQGDFFDGDYTEAVVGYAYRPVNNDRLNALFKYTYFYNLPVADQVIVADSGPSVIQRSHIAAVDVMYDLTPRWTVGGKYAFRYGQVSQDRVNTKFFDSRAHLIVLRADYHFIHKWDALVEGRMLDLPDAQDRLSGALLGVYRQVGNHLKVGAGYNFSTFSDDLTDLDYDHQGVFINIIGKI
jgi:flagellar motor protein MotB